MTKEGPRQRGVEWGGRREGARRLCHTDNSQGPGWQIQALNPAEQVAGDGQTVRGPRMLADMALPPTPTADAQLRPPNPRGVTGLPTISAPQAAHETAAPGTCPPPSKPQSQGGRLPELLRASGFKV